MLELTRSHLLAAAIASAVFAMPASAGAAAPSAGTGKIVCWKDKSGKVIGCGDTVPPEYQQSATKELDKGGVTRKTTESADDVARRRTQEQQQAQQRAEEQKRNAERQRQDSALLNTYTNEKEIDAKRDRDLQVLELQANQLQASLKIAADRESEARTRIDAAQKSKQPVTPALKDDVAHATAEKQKIEASIAGKKKEQEEVRKKYAEFRARFIELKGSSSAPAPAAAKK